MEQQFDAAGANNQPAAANGSTPGDKKNGDEKQASPSGSERSKPLSMDELAIAKNANGVASEEESDERLNNARDAFNDDAYVLPDDAADDGKLD